MARTESFLTAPMPKPVLYFGVPVAFVMLTSFFIVLGFPYDALVENLSVRLESSMNVQLEVDEVDLDIGLLGPGFSFEAVDLQLASGQTFLLDTLYVRPAWSFSWLRLAPAFYLDVETPMGGARGVATLGSTPAWDGELHEVDLERLPLLQQRDLGVVLTGILDATGDIVIGEDGVDGTLAFAARDGDVMHDALPMGLPYQTVEGDLVLGGENTVVIESLEVVSPMMQATMSGRVGAAANMQEAELDLDLAFTKTDPSTIRPMLQNAGVRVSPDGSAQVHIGGNMTTPEIR